MSPSPLRLFEGFGIETELAVVDAETLDVRSIGDEVLRALSGTDEFVDDVELGPTTWSNELVCHVLELKTSGPVPALVGQAAVLGASVHRLDDLLRARYGARVMPGGMHPWMDPRTETRIWPHGYAEVYRSYDAMFDCRRHGWANVQSTHLNLPFGDEQEFGRLTAAIRLVLPLIPALAASSPFVEGRATGLLDNRLDFYRDNSRRVPAMTGAVIPEAAYDYATYRELVFEPIDRGLVGIGAPEAMLGQEWTNARGAIARFDRMAVEIRLIDAQECPAADIGVCALISAVIQGLVHERWSSWSHQKEVAVEPLRELLERTVRSGPDAPLGGSRLATLFGRGADLATAGDLWAALSESVELRAAELERPVETILEHGTLAARILRAAGPEPDRARLRDVYRELCDCLVEGASFAP